MEKKRRKMVGRLDTSNPAPKWHKTIYLENGKLLETIHDGEFSPFPPEPPTPPTPTVDYMYFEAVQSNSTVSMVSTLETAPNLEYSTDGETWQEWQHTTTGGTHTFDILTLSAVGDRVYLRGDNPNGLSFLPEGATSGNPSYFALTGKVNAGGNIMSLLDTTAAMTDVPPFGFFMLFFNFIGGSGALLTAPAMDTITSIGDYGCASMYTTCVNLTSAAGMPALTAIGDSGCLTMYTGCSFAMSDDGTTLNFDFPTPPVTAGSTTYNTAYDVAYWMGNTNGFN